MILKCFLPLPLSLSLYNCPYHCLLPSSSDYSCHVSLPHIRFDEHRGVVCLIQAIGGSLKENARITTFASIKESKDIDSRSDFSVQEIGVLTPKSLRTTHLRTGQVGYVIAGTYRCSLYANLLRK